MTSLMGYATKTEAVVALRQEGKSLREVAMLLGITANAASGLESSAKRKKKRARDSESFTTALAADLIPRSVRQRLRPHAARREITTDRLIADLVIAVAEGDLVNAVLDDEVQ